MALFTDWQIDTHFTMNGEIHKVKVVATEWERGGDSLLCFKFEIKVDAWFSVKTL